MAYWGSHNMAGTRMEAIVDPAGIVGAAEMHDKAVFAKVSPVVVKVLGIDQHGNTVGEFSGFQHGNVIVTAGHALGFSGKPPGSAPPVQNFRALYPDGSEEDVTVLWAPHPSNAPDLMLLKGSHNSAPFRGKVEAVMDTVYAFGYARGEGMPAGKAPSLPSCSKGVVASATPGVVAITADADDSFSGGPVVDYMGRLVGVIKEGLGTTILRVGITPVHDVHTYLLQAGQPGISG